MSSKKVAYDRHFDKVGFLGQTMGGSDELQQQQHNESGIASRSGSDADQFFMTTSSAGSRRHFRNRCSTFIWQAVIIVAVTLLANALFLGLFWLLVLQPALHQTSTSSQQTLQQQQNLRNSGDTDSTNSSLLCGGSGFNSTFNWTVYRDEKCILVVDELRNFKEAEELCRKLDSEASLLSVDSPAEQAFLEAHLFQEQSIVNPIWLANKPKTTVVSTGDDDDEEEEDDYDVQPLVYSNWLADRRLSKRRQAKKAVSPVIKRDSSNACTEMIITHPDQADLPPPEDAQPTGEEFSSKAAGTWTTVPCTKRNLIVCQKRQPPASWSPAKLQSELIQARIRLLLIARREAAAERRTRLFFASKESEIRLRLEALANATRTQLEDVLQAAVAHQLNVTAKSLEGRFQTALQEAQEKISSRVGSSSQQAKKSLSPAASSDDLLSSSIESAIPVGYIYLQLPKSKSPEELWPTAPFIWSDVSWTYSGVFFRVLGGNSGAFGEVQDGQAPHLDVVEAKMCIHKPNNACSALAIEESVSLPKGDQGPGWSGYVNTAGAYLYDKEAARLDRDALRFHVTGGEVRPRNMAIKVWKRTA